MRTYEVILIVQPDLDETALNGVIEKFSSRSNKE